MTVWTAQQKFLNEEHHHIFEQTKDIPGWQEPGDSYKLYEMGYRAGDVILEIGTYGGRSAVVELQGALANPDTSTKPQYFGIDLDINGIWRTATTLEKFDLSNYCLLFHGTLSDFVKEFSIQPTMVFVDGDHRYEGVKSDLLLLKSFLVPGTPILCHDYKNPQNETGELGVRQAVNEFIQEGYGESVGTFGCSILLLATNQCDGVAISKLREQEFSERKADLLWGIGKNMYGGISSMREQLQQSRAELEQSQSRIQALEQQMREQLQQSRAELQQSQSRIQALEQQMSEQLQQSRAELQQSQSRIQAMESSKFWKMRLAWFKVKNMLGIPESP